MNTRLPHLLIILLSFQLSGCLTISTLSAQVTALHTNCKMEDVIINDEVEDLNSNRTWTATCNGNSYYCEHHDSAGSFCDKINTK